LNRPWQGWSASADDLDQLVVLEVAAGAEGCQSRQSRANIINFPAIKSLDLAMSARERAGFSPMIRATCRRVRSEYRVD
jgi:hypothetical protein